MVTPGGGLHYCLKLAELLQRHGATVGILTLRANRETCAMPSGIELLALNGPLTSALGYWLLFPFWQAHINKTIREWQPAVIVPQVFPANWWGWLYKRSHREMPVIWVCHEPSAFIHSRDWINALQPRWKSWLARLLQPALALIDVALSRFSDRIVANSRFTGAMLERIYRQKPAAIAYPAIDHGVFFPGSDRGRQGIITVAKLSRFKRVDFLLKVFSRVLKSRPELVYHIVGSGEDEAALRSLARELGISQRVVFHGRVAEPTLAGLYRQSLLFLHGAVNEPFGMAPLEAIACGTPVIAHKSGGPLEFVNDSCGRLIDSLAEERWSEAVTGFIAMLDNDHDYFAGVAANAETFAWETTLLPLVEIIGER
jgi:glycosyltransferase involved in cell wall biosynthesis